MTETVGDRTFPRWLVVLLGVAATVISVAGLRSAAEVIAPVFLALMLVIAVHPVLESARAHGAPRWLAVTLALLVLYAVVLGLVVTLAICVARLAALLPRYGDEIEGLLDGKIAQAVARRSRDVDVVPAHKRPEHAAQWRMLLLTKERREGRRQRRLVLELWRDGRLGLAGVQRTTDPEVLATLLSYNRPIETDRMSPTQLHRTLGHQTIETTIRYGNDVGPADGNR